MRLIDVDDIGLTDFEIIMCGGDYKEALTMLCQKIDNAKEAIIRCKECKHHNPDMNQCLRQICAEMYDEDFCSRAERRTDD